MSLGVVKLNFNLFTSIKNIFEHKTFLLVRHKLLKWKHKISEKDELVSFYTIPQCLVET